MNKNRLQLDFSLEDADARCAFLHEYLERTEFQKKPLTADELEICSKYLLYGKDDDGTSCVGRKEIQVETKNKTWSADSKKVQSLDYLLDGAEGGGLDETQILKPYQAHYKQVKETFSREDALKRAPDEMKELFKELFHTIDETELLINFYEIQNGKRTKPPRAELLGKFSEEEQKQLKSKAAELSQYQFLKKKHELVERRREQYTLRDSFDTKVKRGYSSPGMPIMDDEVITFDCDAPVLPLGLFTDQTSQKLIFQPLNKLNPVAFTEEELKLISNVYWDRKQNKGKVHFDFREIEHVYQLFLQYFELKDCYLNESVFSTTNFLFRTLEYYLSLTILPDVYRDILKMKIKKFKNNEIADCVNKKYGKTYTANYISTIFRQKIIKQINETARRHETIIENLFFEENFKKCNTCGEWYLICAENFVRKSTSPDGFTNRCKSCDKEKRLKKRGCENG